MSTTKLSQQLHRIAAQWPADPFRPHLQLKSFLDSLADHPQLTPQAVKAAHALLNNDVQRKYKLTDKMLRPKSMPMHYERLVEGVEKSAKGIGRPWWKIFFNIW
ncbi:hypothetical protein QCA50_020987 [Cerrena zonata]|uniref:Uncharacterized protein n=1 Tax=Cerrena zonata TaxID=2478898 RepID=A0AAW0F8D4_9APHY